MPRHLAPLAALGAALFASAAARADVGPDRRLVEDTGFTLREGELKLGVFESSYGLTDRVQVDTILLGDLLTFANAGVKVAVVTAPNLQIAAHVSGGRLLTFPRVWQLWTVAAGLDASLPLADPLWLHVSVGGHYWGQRTNETSDPLGRSLHVGWMHVQGELEWDVTPRHILFLTAGTPTSWLAAGGRGSQDFDALDFLRVTAGWQISREQVNFRIDVGYGPSLVGKGLTGGLDLYWRI